jgi:hypothetical protein
MATLEQDEREHEGKPAALHADVAERNRDKELR